MYCNKLENEMAKFVKKKNVEKGNMVIKKTVGIGQGEVQT